MVEDKRREMSMMALVTRPCIASTTLYHGVVIPLDFICERTCLLSRKAPHPRYSTQQRDDIREEAR